MVNKDDPVECYGLGPANYEGEAMPKLIEYSIIAMGVYGAMLVVLVICDYFSRRFAYSVPAGRKSPMIQVLPLVLWSVLFYILFNSILVNLVNLVMFYGLRAGKSSQENEMACYLAYYTKGGLNDITYGNYGLVIIPPAIVYVLCGFAWMRPKASYNRAVLEAKLMELLPQATCAAAGDTIHLLHLGSSDGVDPLSLAEVIKEGSYGNSSYTGRLKITLSDNYGNGQGQNGIAEAIVRANVERRELSELIDVVCIPAVESKRSIDVVKLPSVADESYDLIHLYHKLDWLALLNIWLEKRGSYIWKGRYVNCFVEMNRVLRRDGVLFVTFEGDASAADEYRKYLAHAGFISNVKVIPGLRRTIRVPTPWGTYNTGITYYQSLDTYFIAAQKASDFEGDALPSMPLQRGSDGSGNDFRSSSMKEAVEKQLALEASIEEIEPELTYRQWNLWWLFFVVVSFSIYAVIFTVTILKFDSLRFPTKAGFINYFAFMLIGVIQNTVISLSGGLLLRSVTP